MDIAVTKIAEVIIISYFSVMYLTVKLVAKDLKVVAKNYLGSSLFSELRKGYGMKRFISVKSAERLHFLEFRQTTYVELTFKNLVFGATVFGLKQGLVFIIRPQKSNVLKRIAGIHEVASGYDVKVDNEEKNYLTMNGQNMWLIQLPNHVQNTETANYKYNGQEMFWSADHNNFVCVVISAEKPSIDASQFELVSVNATQTIAADYWDVNKSGDLDANDAQLIWNMYNNQYENFTDIVTGEKFLLADANHDGILDTKDASVIINQIKASLTTE